MIGPARRLSLRLDKFRRLPADERRLLLQATGVIAWVQLSLWIGSQARVLRRVERRPVTKPSDGTAPVKLSRIGWAVGLASRFVPRTGAPLPMALATLWMLKREGHPGELMLRGDADSGEPRPEVWAQSDGMAVIGARDMRRLEQLAARGARTLIPGPETSLLMLCAKAGLPGQGTEALASLLTEPLDPDRLLALTRTHKLLPFVRSALAALPTDSVPEPIASPLEQRWARNVTRTEARVAELERMLRRFDAQGLRVIPLKGPALAIEAYGDVLGRKFGDLDLLVDPSDYASAEALLAEEGYRPSKRFVWQVALRHRDHDTVIDLHRHAAARMFAIHVDFDGLWQRSEPLRIGETDTRGLGPEDRWLFLSGKLVSDWVGGRLELGRIRDIAQLLSATQPDSWRTRLAEARLRGGERLIALSLELARLTLDVGLPDEVVARIGALHGVPALARRVADELFSFEARVDYAQRVRLYAAQRERASDRRAILFALVRRESKRRAIQLWQAREIGP